MGFQGALGFLKAGAWESSADALRDLLRPLVNCRVLSQLALQTRLLGVSPTHPHSFSSRVDR